jgi:hypothetical protein
MASTAGRSRSATGTGWKRLGPTPISGEARRPHTGSVSTRQPSTSSSTVEWPSQVARRPLGGACSQAARGSSEGRARAARAARRATAARAAGHGHARIAQARGHRKQVAKALALPQRRGVRSRRAPWARCPKDFMQGEGLIRSIHHEPDSASLPGLGATRIHTLRVRAWPAPPAAGGAMRPNAHLALQRDLWNLPCPPPNPPFPTSLPTRRS